MPRDDKLQVKLYQGAWCEAKGTCKHSVWMEV